MIRGALLQQLGNGRLEPEVKSLSVGLARRGSPCSHFLEKQLARGQLALKRDVLIAGHIPVVLSALRQLGIDPQQPNDYPDCLGPWLHRRMWTSVVRDVVAKLQEGSARPFFAKPLDKQKAVSGTCV